MSRAYIIMNTWERDSQSGLRVLRTRKITVVGGQPYYQSTGINSQSPGKWFPFIMLKGDTSDPAQAHNIEKLAPYNLRQLAHTLETPQFGPLYLMKYDNFSVPSKYEKKLHIDLCDGRIPTKATLITANRLGMNNGEAFDQETLATYLDETEMEEAKNPIRLLSRPDFQTDSSYLINNWLIQHGAIAAHRSLAGSDWNNKERIRRETAAAKLLAKKDPSFALDKEMRHRIRQSFFKSQAVTINEEYPATKQCRQSRS